MSQPEDRPTTDELLAWASSFPDQCAHEWEHLPGRIVCRVCDAERPGSQVVVPELQRPRDEPAPTAAMLELTPAAVRPGDLLNEGTQVVCVIVPVDGQDRARSRSSPRPCPCPAAPAS